RKRSGAGVARATLVAPGCVAATALLLRLRDHRGTTIAICPDAIASVSMGHMSATSASHMSSVPVDTGAGAYAGDPLPNKPRPLGVGCPSPEYAGVPPPKTAPNRLSQLPPLSATGCPAPE